MPSTVFAPYSVLVVPGWQNSGPEHWQSQWQAQQPDWQRVMQRDWLTPQLADWVAALDAAIVAATQPVLLVAHSLGCIQVAAWASISQSTRRVQAALLVAPGDVERPDLRHQLPTWQPIAMQALPFPSLLVGSRTDPYCSHDRAQALASAWGSAWLDMGDCGHINAESGLGDWLQGHDLLCRLMRGQPL